MKPGRTSRAALVLAVLATLASAASTGAAQAPTEQEIVESQRRLEQIRRERDALREEMTRIRSRVSDLSSELSNLNQQLDAAAGVVDELENLLGQREQQIERNTYELLMARDQLAERRAVLQRRVRDIYKRGPLGTLQVLLAAESFSDLLNRYRYLYMIAQHDRRLSEEVATLERQLVGRERALRVSLNQLQGVQRERASEHEQLAALQEQQRRALEGVRSREDETARRIDQLEQDAARLGELIATFERRRREAELAAAGGPGAAAAPGAATITPASMGTLPWPTDGSLLYRFGRVTQPNGTVVRWNGIGIAADVGGIVRAVEGGIVALAGPFEGYGPTVIVSHGGGYYTLYLYLGSLRVEEGEQVQRGQVVGTVGDQGGTEGARLEFQIRLPGGQATDPLPWLQRR